MSGYKMRKVAFCPYRRDASDPRNERRKLPERSAMEAKRQRGRPAAFANAAEEKKGPSENRGP